MNLNILNFKTGITFEEIASECNKLTKQPFLITLENGQKFLKLEENFIELKTNFTNCIDLFFKSFWVFNVEYAKEATYLMYFFQLIFKINDDVKPSVKELHQCIVNC